MPAAVRFRSLPTEALADDDVRAIRDMLTVAFGDDPDERFDEDDWQHAVGGRHFVLDVGGEIAAHASVVERELRIADRPVRVGYVEAVATAPRHRGTGFGSRVMHEVGVYIRAGFELGALGTGVHGFYERLGWQTWAGPTSVRTPDGERRTPDEDGFIMVLRTPSSPELRLTDPISCDWRPGDVW